MNCCTKWNKMADLLELNQENDLDIPNNCAILIAEMENKAMNDAYNNLTNRQKVYIDAIREHAEDIGLDTNKSEFSRAELRQVSMKMKGKVWIPNWITHDPSRRVNRGVFNIPEVNPSPTSSDAMVNAPATTDDSVTMSVSSMEAERIADTILLGS